MIHFCYDIMSDPEMGYPNLAKPNLGPDDFDTEWPRAIAFRLTMYLQRAKIPFTSGLVETAPVGSWYPVGLGWHDFDCDYFSLMQPITIKRLKRKEIRVLFYYHEGDNPERIQNHMDGVCRRHGLPVDCYLFISANSAATKLERVHYFPDHDHFLRYINRRQGFTPATDLPRQYNFTALNRIHKWWRASCMSDLQYHNILDQSLWSYNTDCTIDDKIEDNPICVDSQWCSKMSKFLDSGPYFCDGPNETAHNDHRLINSSLYTNSYCHIVLETLFDVDQSGGAFITEKTYKCIKFGQPFVIAGGPGSLQALRDSGYRTFDHAIDNGYDTIEDNTQRWFAIRNALEKIKQQDLHSWYLKCLPDLEYNQTVFNQRSSINLDRLADRLNYRP